MKPLELDVGLFDNLSERSGTHLITILIPTHRKGRDVSQDPIQLKNQLSEVERELESLGRKPRERAERLSQARSLLGDKEFWEHQSDGLALYVDDSAALTPVSVPVGVQPSFYVGQVFHLRHLIPSMNLAKVPVLTVTKKAVRLFSGSKSSIDEVDADLPESFDDVNWFVDREKQRQQHPDRAGAGGRATHGHEPSARAEEDRDRFLRAVADALPAAVRNTPLVVLGDDDLVERFGSIAGLETVSPERSGVGNPADDNLIHEMAVPAIVQIERAGETEALKQAMDRLGVGQGTTHVSEALPAAMTGRIDEVVLERAAEPVWGRVDATTMTVERHEELETGDVDLMDRLVVEARKTSANVSTTAESIEEGDSFVATFRY